MAYHGISPEVYKNIRNNAQLLDDIAVADLLDLDDGTLKLDPNNNRVGINNATPTKTLDVGGDVQLTDLYYTADYPTIRPTLDLAFAQTKQLDSRITFTRNSTGTYTDENGIIQTAAVNTPRFDHDPVTGDSLGLLIEESRTNIQRYSSLIGGTNWGVLSGTHVATTNTTIAPDGTQTASTIVLSSTGGGRFYVQDAVTVTAGATYTLSCWMKTDIGTTKNIALYGVNGAGGTLFTVTDQWVRYSCQVVPINGADYFGFESRLTNASSTGNVYVWGYQVELGSFPTSYIKTLATSVTRSADIATITGTNFTTIYNASEGTLYLEAIGKGVGNTGSNATFQIDDGSSTNRITLTNDNETIVNSLITVSGTQTNLTASPSFTTGVNKNAIAYKSGDNASSLNGSTVVTNTSISTLPVVNTFRFGSNASGTSNNTIRRAIYYPRRLNNSQLQNITL